MNTKRERPGAGPASTSLPGQVGERIAWTIALLAAISPLWVGRDLPLVDLPQHLFVLTIQSRLHDATTLFPRFFELRPGLTPYLGYYWTVGLLGRVFPLELANRLFLSAYVASFPLALGFLLRSLRRPAWPALLAIPFAYGDCFGWGFLNYCAALPLTFLSLGLFLRALTDASRRIPWAALLATSLLAGLAFHPVPAAYLALALPFLLLTTRVPEDRTTRGLPAWLRSRAPALAALLPWVLVGTVWIVTLVGHPAPGQAGAPRVAPGPALSREDLEFETLGHNLGAFPGLLANLMQDGSDQWGLRVSLIVAALAVLAGLVERRFAHRHGETWYEGARPVGLCAAAFGLYLALPLNLQPHIQYLNLRFAPLAAALAAGLLPRLEPRAGRVFLWLAVASSLAIGLSLSRGFAAFDHEAQTLRALVPTTGPRPVIMGLMFDRHSRVVSHPVFLHSAAVLARARGGIPDYCLAGWRQAPVQYRATPPPPLANGWLPQLFDYSTQGAAYDHFLLRGVTPERLFGPRLGGELYVAAHSGDFWLVRRRQ